MSDCYIFARLHARPGCEQQVAAAILEVAAYTREEAGCLSIQDFQSLRDPRLFFIHSRFRDEAAFELHVSLPHTERFVARVEPLIEHPLEAVRTRLLPAVGAPRA